MLKNMKVEKCPICGCTDVIEESVNISRMTKPEILVHCNGERWETREFLCGYQVEHVPNFMTDMKVEYSECFYDKEVVEKREKGKRAAKVKKAFLEAMAQEDVSDDWLETMMKTIEDNRR